MYSYTWPLYGTEQRGFLTAANPNKLFFGGVSHPNKLLCLSTAVLLIVHAQQALYQLCDWSSPTSNFNRANLPLDLLCQDIPYSQLKTFAFYLKA